MNIGSITRRMRALLLVSALALFSVATPLGLATATAQDSAITTRVKVLHAATDTGEVEVHFNGEQNLENFAYGEQSDWIDLDPGSVRVTITAERIGFNYALLDTVYPVPAGNDYYLIITDSLILTGVFDTSSSTFQGSRATFVHGSVDTPAVSVTASGNAVALATELGYAQTSDTSALPAGAYDIEVALSDTGDVVLTQAGVQINENTSNVLVLMGDPNDDEKPLTIAVLEAGLKEDSGTPTS
jgi:hypothetical protein